jgi:predicted metal-dependent HD superfamily phosphohydrolase
MEQKILDKTREYATKRLRNEMPPSVCYHNLAHTKLVVQELGQLAKIENIDENERRILEVAAWMHDLGYIYQKEGHEKKSAAIAEEFLIQLGIVQEERKAVVRLIRATDISLEPSTLLEELIRDADSAHLGLPNLAERSEFLRKETEFFTGKQISKANWLKMNVEFFENHKYYTSAAKEKYGLQKAANLKAAREQLKQMERSEDYLH